ncbi:MAG: polyprenyl diphosphate synthase [Treponema sp.]|nr:polyprenyl diphosphate synthase [Spirochaetales bacterium]MDY5810953.1 polyprenyl diphosphate synthase [Treponema sp.]MEE1182270.1 polyprenyl diphosphate synthase [Treponema sp.]
MSAESDSNIQINRDQLPEHVAIIMDGNGRWAKKRNMIRTNGHTEGLKRAKEIAKAASDLGLKYITFYVFSTENWKRTQEEVGFLMNLIHTYLLSEFAFCKENGIRVKLLGDRTGLPKNVQNDLNQIEKDTEAFTDKLTICLAINYGGRNEIIRGVKKLVSSGINADSITEELISGSFDVPELPDVDLLIRTGGEKRLSNFLMWHSAYAELLFKDTLWPDYHKEEFYSDIAEFQKRTRRFGAVTQ